MRRGVDLHHGLDVVLADHRIAFAAAELRQGPQHLWRATGRPAERQIGQRRKRIELALRRLHHDRIGHTVGWIEPKSGRNLAAAGQVDHQAVGDVAGGEPEVLGPRAVDVDLEHRALVRLLDARIGDARDTTDGLEQLVGVSEVGL